MKTEEEIRVDIGEIQEDKSIKPASKKRRINEFLHLINVIKNLPEEKIRFERDKLKAEIKKLDDTFPEFLKNFKLFRMKHEKDHVAAVKKAWKKEFDINAKKAKLKRLDYLFS